ncbi:MAG: thermonuclease family protein [bacterium]|nr:thermonuclease family protein [bacterium]
MGTRIRNAEVVKVVDGDTINVRAGEREFKLRLTCVDTEESLNTSTKPVTEAGSLASQMAKQYFPVGELVDLEFDTNDPVEVCLLKHLDNYGRLLCYVHKDGENFNLKLVREGWSPYFVKYGRARFYHDEFTRAEREAQATGGAIWNPALGNRGDYDVLIAWWSQRALIVEDYRRTGLDTGVLSVRIDYQTIVNAAENDQTITVLCDLQAPMQQWPGGGALIYAGSPTHKFNLWIPEFETEAKQPIVRLLNTRYIGTNKRNYVYITGQASLYGGKPQIVLESLDQISDFPPGM